MKLDDPAVVRREFESEVVFARRRPFYAAEARDLAFDALADVAPRRVLEVGCGPGDFAERVARELRAGVIALDLSPRMAHVARERGVDARVGDVLAVSRRRVRLRRGRLDALPRARPSS